MIQCLSLGFLSSVERVVSAVAAGDPAVNVTGTKAVVAAAALLKAALVPDLAFYLVLEALQILCENMSQHTKNLLLWKCWLKYDDLIELSL